MGRATYRIDRCANPDPCPRRPHPRANYEPPSHPWRIAEVRTRTCRLCDLARL